MSIGLIAQKCGMTRVFMPEEGASVPVTVLLVEPNRITQLKTKDKDGYTAVQVTKGKKKPQRVTKALSGHFKRANVEAGAGLWEFRVEPAELEKMTLGGELTVSLFETGQTVDVSGIVKGRGFTGVIQRHNFSSQRASHGNSLSHNAPGSIGQNQSPGRVFKGKKMAGHYGATKSTIQNLKVVQVDLEKNLLLVKGAIPGAPGGLVVIKPAVKQRKTDKEKGGK